MLTNPLLDCARDGKNHTVVSFLERPINFRTASWGNQAAGARLASFNFPSDVVKSPMYARKLQNFLALRADLVVRVQVNAQPFHAGRLMLSWTPFLNYLGSNRTYYYTNTEQEFLTPVSGNPRVEIDLSTTTEATMTIPFVSPFLYYNLVTGAGDIGTFQLIVYSPLVDLVSGGNIDYTIWVNMTNVRAEFPTGMPTSVAQVGKEDDTQQQQGFITKQTSAYSTILEPLTNLPVVGQMIGYAKTGVDALHAVAATHGWSKPHNTADIQLFKQAPARYMCNSDGSDMATNLGMSATNEIEQLQSLFRTEADEMSIDYVARTYNYVGRFKWNKGQGPGSRLYSHTVSPVSWFAKTGSTGLCVPHLFFCATNFVLWRGGINIKFKFVKTKFHSGRVRIYYVPGFFDGTLPIDFEHDANYSTVVDLRSDTDVEFNLPFVATVPWLHIKESPWIGSFNQTQVCGTVYMEVLNELVNTSTVSDTVEVLVEVCGAEDIEFAVPIQPNLTPREKPNNKRFNVMEKLTRSVAQVGTDTGDTPLEDARDEPTNFAEVPLQPKNTTFNEAMLTMGEKITSFRQLIKRFHMITPLTPERYWKFSKPFWINPNKFVGTTQEGTDTLDALSWFASLYAFYRGSTRIKIAPLNANGPMQVLLKPTYLYGNGGIIEPDATWPRTDSRGADVFLPRTEGIFELSIPYYSSYPVTLTTFNAANSDVLDARNGFNRAIATFHQDTQAYVYRAAGDDFSFGFLLGAPVLNHSSQ
ncbi:hypothetical protein 2 [Wuhan insect virus 33]|uniref:hypothetical protein 2 n=1 Tax=Wuhan insect virus 33 TaxID=1923736 RepID=UPI000909719B|nr:hypothetical protein 2 [Wuhan insect virus 33]APG78418.1 hypothetical protein 2 [Wuhan insect virus 33]